ncbi:hypothetical protein ACFSQD_11360 [Flavihumibacter stibioxidans]|nr:hypothetical protein [Flavihumibacter stibioxidans]
MFQKMILIKRLQFLWCCCSFCLLFSTTLPAQEPEGSGLSFLYQLKLPVLPVRQAYPTRPLNEVYPNLAFISKLKEGKVVSIDFGDGMKFDGMVRVKSINKKPAVFLQRGKLTFANGEVMEGWFNYMIYTNWESGTYTFKDGTRAVLTNAMQGVTTKYYFPNGDSCLEERSMNSYIYYSRGASISGNLESGNSSWFDGQVVVKTADQSEYKGRLQHHQPDGLWTFKKNDQHTGSIYFVDGKLWGILPKTGANGTLTLDYYENNRLVQPNVPKIQEGIYCIKGDCKNGKGEAFIQFQGERPWFMLLKAVFKNGLPDGKGEGMWYTHRFEEYGPVSGEMKGFSFHGNCTEMSDSGKSVFTGIMEGNRKVKGLWVRKGGYVFDGLLNDEVYLKGFLRLPNGDSYEGDFDEKGYRGKGVYTMANGNRFESNHWYATEALACTYRPVSGEIKIGEFDVKSRSFAEVDYVTQFKKMVEGIDAARKPSVAVQGNGGGAGQTCGTCNGSGSHIMTCPSCKGDGYRRGWVNLNEHGRSTGTAKCLTCSGRGTIGLAGACRTCRGYGRIN